MGLFGGKTKNKDDEREDKRKKRHDSRAKSRPDKKKSKSSDKKSSAKKSSKNDKRSSSSKDDRRKPKNELLSSVLDESVPGASLTELRENKKFTTKRDGETYHIALMLNADEIGGLSRKAASRSEDKGAIIECIASGRIKVIATNALMRANRFIIIPDKATLEAADEFSILRTAPYTAAYIEDTGADTFTRIDEGPGEPIVLSFEDAVSVQEGELTIDELLVERADKPAEVGSKDSAMEFAPSADGRDVPKQSIDKREEKIDSSAGDVPDSLDEDFIVDEVDDIPEFEDIILDEPELDATVGVSDRTGMNVPEVVTPAGVTSELPPVGERAQAPDEFDMVEEVFEPDPVVTAPVVEHEVQMPLTHDEAPEPAPAQVISQEELNPVNFEDFAKSMTRTFYSSSLPFEVSMEPFDNMFVTNNEAPQFSIDRGEGWLAEQLTQMSKDANADLRRLHQENLAYLSQRYAHLMGLYIDGLVRRVDISDSNNRYGKMREHLRAIRDDKMKNINAIAEQEASRLDEMFEQQVKAHGEEARLRAESQYRSRHERDREQSRNRILSSVRADIDAQYRSDMDDMMSMRQEEAATRIDYGVTQILGILHEQYDSMRREEMERFEAYRESFNRWIDDNRKEDIAYAQAIAEDQRQGEKSERLRRDYEQQFEQQKAAFDTQKASLEARIDEIKRERDERIAEIEQRMEERVARAEEERDLANERLSDAMEKYNNLGEEKDREYERRMATLRDENESNNIKFVALTKQHRSASILWIAVAVIAIICSFSIGIIFGFSQNVNNFAQNNSTIVAEDFSGDESFINSILDY